MIKPVRPRLARIALAIAVFVVPGCEDDGGDTPAEGPVAGTSADWYGKITAEASTYRTERNVSGNLTQHVKHDEVVTMFARVTKEGARSHRIKGTMRSYTVTDITLPCYQQHGTSLTTAYAPEKDISTGVPAIPGVPVPGLPTGYFALRVDEGGGYVFAEGVAGIPGLPPDAAMELQSLGGSTIADAHTDNFAATSTCDGGITQESENDTQAPLGIGVKLGRLKGQLSADGKSASGRASWREGDTDYTLRWSLKKAKELEAEVGGPYTIERGSKVTLDGSRSRGDIEKYVWTLTPRGDCKDTSTDVPLQIGREAEQTGQTYTFTAVCGVDVKLVVHGRGGKEDADSGQVDVTPRTWKTPYITPEKLVVDDNPYRGGVNECAFDAVGARSGHYIHTSSGKPGYEVRHVDDPDGPFVGGFFLDSSDLKVWRREVRELDYIGPNGDIFVGTGAPFNALLESQIDQHESAHSTLVEAALKRDRGKRNPAQLIESLASNDETALRAAAGSSISKSDRVLCEATQHPFVFEKLKAFANVSGVVRARDGSVVATVPSLQTLANDDVTCP
jgi:hypothetical protein